MPGVTTWGVVVAAVFAAQLAFILTRACPGWALCCFPLPFTPILFSMVALLLGGVLLMRAIRQKPWRKLRLVLALVLLCFGADFISGGSYRWFEVAMRMKLREGGGPAALQAWAEKVLSPENIGKLDQKEITYKDLPVAFQDFGKQFHPFYRRPDAGGPDIQFEGGGHVFLYGLIVGKKDLPAAYPKGKGLNAGPAGWSKKLQPGVFLYSEF